MRKIALVCVPLCLFAGASMRLVLVAKEPDPSSSAPAGPATVDSVKAQERELRRQLEKFKEDFKAFPGRVEAWIEKNTVRVEELTALAKDPTSPGAEAKRRAELVNTGGEAQQLDALKDADSLGDEGLLLIGAIARDTSHASVRRKALAMAMALGEAGHPAVAYAWKSLSSDDRVYLVEQLAANGSASLPGLAAMSKEADVAMQQALVEAAMILDDGLLLIAIVAKDGEDKLVTDVIGMTHDLPDERALLMLYAAARDGNPQHKIAALQAAARRKEAGLAIVAAAYDTKDGSVRGAVVRAAKEIGGDVSAYIIDHALADEDTELRAAAQEAAKE